MCARRGAQTAECNCTGRCGISPSFPVTVWRTARPRMVSLFFPPRSPFLNLTEQMFSWRRWNVYHVTCSLMMRYPTWMADIWRRQPGMDLSLVCCKKVEKVLNPYEPVIHRWLQLTQESLRRKVNLVLNHKAPVTACLTVVHYQLLCGGSDSKGVYSMCVSVWAWHTQKEWMQWQLECTVKSWFWSSLHYWLQKDNTRND